ncbi:MAG: response regulator transcription factor [Bacteroides sp.]|nr:response regulator transcription factor [Bacteroides sp.]
MRDKRHILIVDDDIYIGNMTEEVLTKEGYTVSRAYSGTEALMLLSDIKPDLVLLDLMLPGLSGEELLPRIADIPVIVVSAKADTENKVKLLLGGAADYITKPFEINELLARITVRLRDPSDNGSGCIEYEDMALYTDTHTVRIGGKETKLTRTECAILKLLMLNPRRVIAKSTLLDRISQDTPDCTEGSLKMHVSNLRKKLKEISGRDQIEAVWGIGFKLNVER